MILERLVEIKTGRELVDFDEVYFSVFVGKKKKSATRNETFITRPFSGQSFEEAVVSFTDVHGE